MSPGQAALIAGTGCLAGAINAVAGGGSFLTLPVLVGCGVPAVPANASSTVALWPGTLASFGAYRSELASRDDFAWSELGISLLGGVVGAFLLLATPAVAFDHLLPWLTLTATLVFALGPRLAAFLRVSASDGDHRLTSWGLAVVQFALSTYGGYYGAGAGIMLLAVFALRGMTNIHAMNALKTLMTSAFNGAAVVTFVLRGVVHWPETGWMMMGGLIGGYGGAWLARRLPVALVRGFVLTAGALTTVYFFQRAYFRG